MKLAKTTVLGAVAVIASMAMASSASATICSGEGTGEGCVTAAYGKHWTGKYQATTTKAHLRVTNAAGVEIRTGECESKIEGSITNATTNAGNVSALTFTFCNFTNCLLEPAPTLVAPRTGGPAFPWAVTVKPSGKNDSNGTLNITTPSMKFTGTCSGLMGTCEYEAATAIAEIKGGSPASLVFNNAQLKRTTGAESFCGAALDWSGTYTVKNPTSLYIE